MPTEVLLPQIDVDAANVTIARWFAKNGASVDKGEALFEIETDKAAIEVEAPAAGTIHNIVSPSGGSLPVGSIVAWIFREGEVYEPQHSSQATASKAAVGAPAMAAVASPIPVSPSAETEAPTSSLVDTVRGGGDSVRATPLARRVAREQGIDLGRLTGSGPRGRIQERDVLRAAELSQERRPHVKPHTLHRTWLRQGDGPPIVLVHGFGSESASWRAMLSGETLFRPILAVDLPGHGKSPLRGSASFEDLVEALEETLVSEGLEGVDLVGHSLGGAIITALTTSSRLDVHSLFLISPAGLGPDINGSFLAGFCRAKTEPSLTPWMRLTVAKDAHLSSAVVKATLRHRAETGVDKDQEQLVTALFPNGTQSFSIRNALEHLSIPVKVLFGAEDRIIPAHHALGLPGTIAVHIFPSVGHTPHIEVRKAVMQLLSEIVRRQ
jgi:pimeloyl-ACP methyl ester carboxylesterase